MMMERMPQDHEFQWQNHNKFTNSQSQVRQTYTEVGGILVLFNHVFVFN